MICQQSLYHLILSHQTKSRSRHQRKKPVCYGLLVLYTCRLLDETTSFNTTEKCKQANKATSENPLKGSIITLGSPTPAPCNDSGQSSTSQEVKEGSQLPSEESSKSADAQLSDVDEDSVIITSGTPSPVHPNQPGECISNCICTILITRRHVLLISLSL